MSEILKERIFIAGSSGMVGSSIKRAFLRIGFSKNSLSEKLRFLFLSQGLNIRPIGSTVYLMPPYCISDKDLDKTYNNILETLNSLSS